MSRSIRPRKPAPPPEREVLKGVLDALKMFGVDASRNNTGAMRNPSGRLVRFGNPGDADIRGVMKDGRALSIEVKKLGERPRPEQFDHLHRINASGGVAFWVDDIETFVRLFPAILAGARIEIDSAGTPWVCGPDDTGGTKP